MYYKSERNLNGNKISTRVDPIIQKAIELLRVIMASPNKFIIEWKFSK